MRIRFKQYVKGYKPEENEEDVADEEIMDVSDPSNYAGNVRVVPGAHLIYKRKVIDDDEVESYEELWIYNINDEDGMERELAIKNEIIAGTDIKFGHVKSNDGKQFLDIYSVGNVQYIHIQGLPE